MNLRERLQNGPVWVAALFSGVLFAVLFTGVQVLLQHQPVGLRTLVTALFEAIFFSLFMGLFFAHARRASGGATAANELARAVKGGQIPAGADTQAMSKALSWRTRQASTTRWLGPVVFGLFALLGVWLALSAPWWWLLVAFFLALAVFTSLSSARDLRRIETIQSQLAGHTHDSGA